MDIDALVRATKDTVTIKRVFGEPVECDGVVVIPAAVVVGGGGAGQSEGNKEPPGGSGGGFGMWARPIGVYVVRDGRVGFRPAIDVIPLAVLLTLLLPRLVRAFRRSQH